MKNDSIENAMGALRDLWAGAFCGDAMPADGVEAERALELRIGRMQSELDQYRRMMRRLYRSGAVDRPKKIGRAA